ncbi:MAG: PAS domain-containing protein [Mucilaginibacter sp.]
MRNHPERVYSLLQSIEGIVWEADLSMQQFNLVSDRVQPILGYSAEEWQNKRGLWESMIHPDDKQIATAYRNLSTREIKNHTFDYRLIRADGRIVWIRDNVSVIYNGNDIIGLGGFMQDNTETERLNMAERLERDMLRINSDLSVPLNEVLLGYLQGLEALFPEMICSIHLVKNNRLAIGISPSLPPDYLNALIDLPIGENVGSCGTAAAQKRQVIASDILTDPRWENYRSLTIPHNLRACWSNPVIDTDGEVMATLGMYYREPKSPGDEELKIMARGTALLQIVLENRKKTEIIKEANLLMLQSQELAHFGNWRWDIQQDRVSWSPALYTIYGLDPRDFKATFAGYQELLHPEDRQRIYQTIENVLKTGEEVEFQERIIRPDGEIRYLRSWAELKSDINGQPLEMIGACLDITERISHIDTIEKRNKQLLDIAWMQSHLLRAPVVKIMGLIDLIKDAFRSDPEKKEIMDHLLSSAHQLDEQIRDICLKTESHFNTFETEEQQSKQ